MCLFSIMSFSYRKARTMIRYVCLYVMLKSKHTYRCTCEVLALPKEKLTLSVDKEVVDKAKKLGVNISDITEKVLTGYTAAEKPEGDLYSAYRQLFDAINPLLKEFDCSIKIGEGFEQVTWRDTETNKMQTRTDLVHIILCPDGSFYVEEYDIDFDNIEQISPGHFYTPERILTNLVKALANSKEKREEQVKEIFMAKRIVEAMSESLLKKPPDRQEG